MQFFANNHTKFGVSYICFCRQTQMEPPTIHLRHASIQKAQNNTTTREPGISINDPLNPSSTVPLKNNGEYVKELSTTGAPLSKESLLPILVTSTCARIPEKYLNPFVFTKILPIEYSQSKHINKLCFL